MNGRGLPSGLRQAERLPEPIFTTTTKAESGHDEPLTESEAEALVGAGVYEQARTRVARDLRPRRRARRARAG